MRVLRRQQAQELDRISMDEMGISGISLMGNAGQQVAKIATDMLKNDTSKRIAICCGKGNNGGDGFAAAIHLKSYKITLFSIPKADEVSGDAKHFYQLCLDSNLPIFHKTTPPKTDEYDLVIDALLGTGFQGEIRPPVVEWTKWVKQCSGKILAVDAPSGVNADTGTAADGAVIADVTVTMGKPKTGLRFNPGSHHSGTVVPVEIGFPDIDDQLTGYRWSDFNEALCYRWLKPPAVDTYKHKQGKVLILAGSTGMTGAAALATYGALRSGAGLTVTCAPASLNETYETNIIEGMTLSCPDEGKGYLSESNFSDMKCMFEWADVLLIGPGLGGNESTVGLVEKLVKTLTIPMIIDADALRIFVHHHDLFDQINSDYVLTPHYGELAAIVGTDHQSIKNEFPSEFESLLNKTSGVVVAKNAPTCTGKNGHVVLNNSGHQGLATAGTGDVLAGMISGLISQGIPPFEASQIGVFLHGKAADSLIDESGFRGLIATDLLTQIPKVMRQYELT